MWIKLLFLVSCFWFLVSGFLIQDFGLDSGIGFLVSGVWFWVSGFCFLASGLWIVDYGFWFLVGTVAVQQLKHDARGHELRHELSPCFTDDNFV